MSRNVTTGATRGLGLLGECTWTESKEGSVKSLDDIIGRIRGAIEDLQIPVEGVEDLSFVDGRVILRMSALAFHGWRRFAVRAIEEGEPVSVSVAPGVSRSIVVATLPDAEGFTVNMWCSQLTAAQAQEWQHLADTIKEARQ